MAALKIPVSYLSDSVLIADDEPEHLEWLVDFLQSLGLKVSSVLNVEDAMAAGSRAWYRIYIVDLNIPLANWPEPDNPLHASYPGFAIIQGIRSQGNDGRRVIAYSAHLNDQIQAEMRHLYTDYVAKGRPIQLKDRIKELLALPDQTVAALKRRNDFEARQQARLTEKRAMAKVGRLKAASRPRAKLASGAAARTSSKTVATNTKTDGGPVRRAKAPVAKSGVGEIGLRSKEGAKGAVPIKGTRVEAVPASPNRPTSKRPSGSKAPTKGVPGRESRGAQNRSEEKTRSARDAKRAHGDLRREAGKKRPR